MKDLKKDPRNECGELRHFVEGVKLIYRPYEKIAYKENHMERMCLECVLEDYEDLKWIYQGKPEKLKWICEEQSRVKLGWEKIDSEHSYDFIRG
jgi:hypothetical protein